MEKLKNTLYQTFMKLMKQKNNGKVLPAEDNTNYCFMLHDEGLNEIHKVEANEFSTWLSDGSFEKNNKLYISFLVKKF